MRRALISVTRSFLPATDLNKVKLQEGQKMAFLFSSSFFLQSGQLNLVSVPWKCPSFSNANVADDLRRAVVEKFRNFFVAHDVPCDGLVKDEIASRGCVRCERRVAIFVVRCGDIATFADKAVPGI